MQRPLFASSLAALMLASIAAPAQRIPEPTEQQLAADLTRTPSGHGAVFIPALTDAESEPAIAVFSGKDRVALGVAGRRVVLPPGDYTVYFGTGELEQRPSRQVTIVDGETVTLEPFFAALQVRARDPRGRQRPVDYVLRRVDDDELWPTTRTPRQGDAATWIVAPGRYEIVLGDDASRAGERFAFWLPEGQVTRYDLVVDGRDLVRAEFTEDDLAVHPHEHKPRWDIGASFGLMRARRTLGAFNGDVLRLGGFSHTHKTWQKGQSSAALDLRVRQVWFATLSAPEPGRGAPFQKLDDEVRLGLRLERQVRPMLSMYLDARGWTSFFNTYFFPSERVTLRYMEDEETVLKIRTADPGDRVRLLQLFAPSIAQQGVGVKAARGFAEFGMAAGWLGFASRQALYRDSSVITSAQDGIIELQALDDKIGVGPEAGVMARLDLGDVFEVTSRADFYLPGEMLWGGSDFRPVLRWDTEAQLELGRFISLVYRASVRRDDQQIEPLQYRHDLAFELRHELF